MRNIFLLLIAIVAHVNNTKAQTDWINYKVDNKLSIKLPGEPKKVDDVTAAVFGSDSLIYIVSLVDLQKSDGTDSAKLVSISATKDYIDMMRSKLAGTLTGFAMNDMKLGKWNNYNSYYIEGVDASNKRKLYCLMYIIGRNLYGMTVLVPDGKSSLGKDDFLASAVLH